MVEKQDGELAEAVPEKPRRLLRLAGVLITDFSGIIVFYAVFLTFGLRAAIFATLLFVLFDVWRRRRSRAGFPRLYILTTSLALLFGAIDLYAANPFMLKYEGVVTEGIVSLAFAFGARERSLIEELALQQRPGLDFPGMRRFFQLLTVSWAIYAAAMALLYLWAARHLGFAEAVGLRQIAGLVGMAAMMAFSLSGRFAFRIFRGLRLIRSEHLAAANA